MIFLVGYRAVGKSTIGRLLAEELSLDFIDLDDWICDNASMSVADIVKNEGWEGFRERESAALLEMATRSNTVVATGGGAVLHQKIWPALQKTGLVVWLQATTETLCNRLLQTDSALRPSLTGVGLVEEIEAVLKERLPLYALVAESTVATDDISIEKAVEKIVSIYKDSPQRVVSTK